MPQGLPKKIEISLLLPDLALELGDPPPRRRSLVEDRAPQRRFFQRPFARPTGTTQRFQAALPHLLLPFVQPLPVDLQLRGHSRGRLAGRQPSDRSALNFCRYRHVTLHQFLSSRETVRSLLSHFWGALHRATAGAGR